MYFIGIWQGFGFNMVLYLVGLTSVHSELYHAAEMDGANRLADVGLITDAPEHEGWERIHIEQSQYVLYCLADHRFARQKQVSLVDLQHETLIVPEKGSLTQRLLGQRCKQHDITLTRTVTMTTFPLMCEAVLQGIGVALFLRNSSLIQDNVA